MIPFAWSNYSRRMRSCILNPPHVGRINEAKGRLVTGEVEGQLRIDFDVNTESGLIDKARFTCFGPTLLVAAAEALCNLIESKNLSQAARITDSLIERELCDPKSGYSFSVEERVFFELVRMALGICLEACSDIDSQVISPLVSSEFKGGRVDFLTLEHTERLALIDSVLDEHIRPYIELDAGGIVIKELQGLRLIVAYEGACTSCPSAIGGTLRGITETLKRLVHPELNIEPDMEGLNFLYANTSER